MGWKSFGVVQFDLGPLLQGQTRIAKHKSAYKSLIIIIIGPRGLGYEINLLGNLLAFLKRILLL